MNKKLILAAAGGISYFEYTRYMKFIDSISVKAENFKLNKAGANLEIRFNLVIQNNSSKSIHINSVRGVMTAGNTKIGQYLVNQETKLLANATTNLPVIAFINYNQLAKNIQGKNLEDLASLTFYTYASVKFKVLGIFGVNIPIKDKTNVDTSKTVKNFMDIANAFKVLFKK